jgi:cobalt-zinc-cadmium efflux system outer membrane protein
MSRFLSLRRRCSGRHWALLALALTCVAAPAWSATPIGFDEAVRLAEARAPTLQARRSQIEAAREEAARAGALPDPRLTFGLTNLPVTGTDAFDLRADDMTMRQVGVMQEFPARAKRQSRQAMADRMIEQTQALSLAERLAVRQAAAEAWIGLWTAQREVEALQAQRAQSALAIRIAKARLAGGTGTAADALAVQSAALELDNRIDAAEAAVEVARSTLARWLGIAPEEVTIIGAPSDLTVLPVDEATLLTSTDRQGALLAWRSRESVAEAAVTAALADTRPDWSVSAMYGQRARRGACRAATC